MKEDQVAQNILHRAELARITRQLKSRLSKTNFKISKPKRLSSSPIHTSSQASFPSSSIAPPASAIRISDSSHVQMPPIAPTGAGSAATAPTLIPSSPPIPKTPPPPSHRMLHTGNQNSSSSVLSSSSQFKGREEGADLLMYLATSPSPYKTPIRWRTPGFNLNDYVAWSPSPREKKGEVIKF